jgi:hypothetical protein
MNPYIKAKVNGPATGLITAGVLSGLSGLVYLLIAAKQAADGMMPRAYGNEAYMTGYRMGYISGLIAAFLSLILSPIIIFGAMRMMKLTNYKLAKTAAILALIPCTSCCFLLGIPIGIWVLIVLSKPEVKQAFDQPYEPYSPGGYGWNP